MSVPELPYKISSPEKVLTCLRKITKLFDEFRESFDELRSHLNKVYEKNQTMYNSMVAKLQNFNLQTKPQVVPVSDLSPSKVTYQKICVSYDIAPDLDPVQKIA